MREHAAGVDGELVDVISNMGVVRAFGATLRERRRFGLKVGQEMAARRSSLLYLEKLRLIHAAITALLTAGVVAFGILLWQRGQATVGDIALLTALAMTILNSTRDLAVALVNLTQQVARLAEAIGALLTPHELPDRADARRSSSGRAASRSSRCALPTRAGRRYCASSTWRSSRGSASGWWAPRAPANPPCWRCCSGSTTWKTGAS